MLAILATTTTLLLAGCGEDDGDGPSTTPPDDSSTLVVCTSTPFEPAEFREDDELVGYDIDIMAEVADRLDRDLRWVDTDFDTILDELDDDRCQAAIASIAMTQERTERAAFVPYLLGTREDPSAPEGPDREVPDPDAPPIGIAVGSDDELRAEIEQAITAMYDDGTMGELLEQWDASSFLLDAGTRPNTGAQRSGSDRDASS